MTQTRCKKISWDESRIDSQMRFRRFALSAASSLLAALFISSAVTAATARQQPYYGSLIGKLIGRSHNVSGEVYAVDEQTLFIKDFNYDGQAPDAYFWSSAQAQGGPAQAEGFIVPDEKGSTKPLERYVDKDIVLRLPEGKTLREIHWLSVWSRANKQSSGEIMIGRQLQTPRPLEIGPFSQLAHGLKSGPITIVDAQTFLVPDFHYDGLGPEAFFWLTRGAGGLGPSGLKLKDENGMAGPLRKYSGETVVISLPDELTIHDFDYFGVWCTKFQVNFGQVRIPQAARVPPSPKMLGIKPENKLNCEILYDDLGYEIRWVLDGDDIVMQLVGKIEPGEYMAFGLGKDDSKSDMQNADAVVAWVDRSSGQVHAVDYYLGAKQQCVNDPKGSCPDSKLPGGGDSLTLLHGAIVNGYSMVTFKRPQLGVDEQYDQHVYSDGQQSVLWAIGSLNKQQEIGYHRLKTKSNMFIDFARNPQWNCPIPDLNASMHTNLPIASASQLESTVVSAASEQTQKAAASPGAITRQPSDWFIPSLVCPPERTFYAQLGPTGGRKGYEARTGRTGWGLSWYVNGIMIPELVIERGVSYRFVVEGGSDKTSAARRHPFYLTDSPDGGFDFKTDDERLKERIFAGVALRGDGQFVPTAEGRLCEWRPSDQSLATDPDAYPTFAAYQRSLKLDCQPGHAAILKFTPDANTPDQLYYQCYTHRFMGWRVRVVDSCSDYLKSQQDLAGGQNVPAIGSRSDSGRPIYERRFSFNGPDEELLEAASSPSFALDRMLIRAVKSMAEQRQSLFDFGDEAAATALATTELTNFPSDMLILNSSVLNQRQPFNMSTIEQILRLSPSDLEFIGSQAEEEPMFNTPVPYPNALPLQHLNGGIAFDTPPLKTANHKKRKTSSNKQPPATWNSYIRRLASIYYPVQQQLTSMLSSGGGNNQASQTDTKTSQKSANQIIAAPSEQSGSFSLSNLVPKPKIDLSKSGITKKLNKLRFKSGSNQKQEKLSQPPTPAIEFNYDIFNNQLAQLEKQQKQLQSMELLTWPPPAQQQSLEPFNFGPMMQSASVEQQTINSIVPHLMYPNPIAPMANHQLYTEVQAPPRAHQQNFMQKIRVQVPPREIQVYRELDPNQQPFYPPQSSGRPMASLAHQMKLEQPWPPETQQQEQVQTGGPPLAHQEHSVFVTRVPQLSSYVPNAMHHNLQPNQQPQPEFGSQQVSARYPNIQPYIGQKPQPPQLAKHQPQHRPSGDHPHQQQHPTQQQMSSLPSVALTIHDSPNKEETESLSGSSSGSQYEFKQPVRLTQTESGEHALKGSDADHMLAIERFSNSRQQMIEPASSRWPLDASGSTQIEQFRFAPQSSGNELAASASHHQQSETLVPTNTTDQQPRRYSNLLIDRNVLASSEPTIPGEDRTRATASESSRVNTSKPQVDIVTNTPISIITRPTTTDSTLTTLVGPGGFSFAQDLASSTTAPNVGPLVPSLGPPLMSFQNQQQHGLSNGETVLKSTLVEPISSTLIQTPAPLTRPPIPSLIHLDSNPFTPIQLRPNPIYQHFPMLSASRFGPSILIESMFRSQEQPHLTFRPEPPVQVASYLAQHLTSHGEGNKQAPPPLQQQQQQINQTNQDNKSSSSPGDLIVLKPTMLAKQSPQTYMLRPEHYITNSQNSKSVVDESLSNADSRKTGSELGGPTRRIAGRQFDRLSSLSSPPSTSIALDPLQADNSKNTFAASKHTNTTSNQQAQIVGRSGNAQLTGDNPQQLIDSSPTLKAQSQTKTANLAAADDRTTATGSTNGAQQHRQSLIPNKPIPLNYDPMEQSHFSHLTSADDGFRPNPGGENTNTLHRNNQTDNAILSHVMSLISSNAIPTPPLIPVASYSSADYFLPISDRNHRSIRG